MIYGYTRVSTQEQASDDKTSLEDQTRRIDGAAMVLGATIEKVYSDPGVSGSIPLFGRDGGRALHQALKPGDTIIAARMDRMFRSAVDALNTIDQLRQMGVKVILVDIGIEPVTEGAVSRLFFTILAAFAEFDKYRIHERNMEGRRGKRSRGGFVGGQAPYGYRVLGQGSQAQLEEDEHEQQIIGRIRVLGANSSARHVAGLLRHAGIVNPRTGRAFHPETVSRILKRGTDGGSGKGSPILHTGATRTG